MLLYFQDANAPIYLHTDASDYGIGAYLFQVVDNKEQPILFMSKTLSSSEQKWKTIDKEAYAIVYALYKFDHLLRGAQLTLRTDHKNLTYLVDSKSERVQRWRTEMQEYDFVVEHIAGEANVLADAFSRQLELDEHSLYNLEDEIRIEPQYYKLISHAHNSRVGHHGVDRTIEKLKRYLQHKKIQPWSLMRQHVKLLNTLLTNVARYVKN